MLIARHGVTEKEVEEVLLTMKGKTASDAELAVEAKRWDERTLTPADWQDAPEAVPRAAESIAISIRLPRKMLTILKEFADRAGIGYQVLMKMWLDERIREEARQRKPVVSPAPPKRKKAVK